jgi:hypothetical protein
VCSHEGVLALLVAPRHYLQAKDVARAHWLNRWKQRVAQQWQHKQLKPHSQMEEALSSQHFAP